MPTVNEGIGAIGASQQIWQNLQQEAMRNQLLSKQVQGLELQNQGVALQNVGQGIQNDFAPAMNSMKLAGMSQDLQTAQAGTELTRAQASSAQAGAELEHSKAAFYPAQAQSEINYQSAQRKALIQDTSSKQFEGFTKKDIYLDAKARYGEVLADPNVDPETKQFLRFTGPLHMEQAVENGLQAQHLTTQLKIANVQAQSRAQALVAQTAQQQRSANLQLMAKAIQNPKMIAGLAASFPEDDPRREQYGKMAEYVQKNPEVVAKPGDEMAKIFELALANGDEDLATQAYMSLSKTPYQIEKSSEQNFNAEALTSKKTNTTSHQVPDNVRELIGKLVQSRKGGNTTAPTTAPSTGPAWVGKGLSSTKPSQGRYLGVAAPGMADGEQVSAKFGRVLIKDGKVYEVK